MSGGMSGQLAFDLGQRNGFARDDFFPSASNRAALAMVDGWKGWPSGRMLLLAKWKWKSLDRQEEGGGRMEQSTPSS